MATPRFRVSFATLTGVPSLELRTASVEGETTKHAKYSKRAATPQDDGRVLRDCARTLSLVPSRNSDAREILLRSLSPEYADGTLPLYKVSLSVANTLATHSEL